MSNILYPTIIDEYNKHLFDFREPRISKEEIKEDKIFPDDLNMEKLDDEVIKTNFILPRRFLVNNETYISEDRFIIDNKMHNLDQIMNEILQEKDNIKQLVSINILLARLYEYSKDKSKYQGNSVLGVDYIGSETFEKLVECMRIYLNFVFTYTEKRFNKWKTNVDEIITSKLNEFYNIMFRYYMDVFYSMYDLYFHQKKKNKYDKNNILNLFRNKTLEKDSKFETYTRGVDDDIYTSFESCYIKPINLIIENYQYIFNLKFNSNIKVDFIDSFDYIKGKIKKTLLGGLQNEELLFKEWVDTKYRELILDCLECNPFHSIDIITACLDSMFALLKGFHNFRSSLDFYNFASDDFYDFIEDISSIPIRRNAVSLLRIPQDDESSISNSRISNSRISNSRMRRSPSSYLESPSSYLESPSSFRLKNPSKWFRELPTPGEIERLIQEMKKEDAEEVPIPDENEEIEKEYIEEVPIPDENEEIYVSPRSHPRKGSPIRRRSPQITIYSGSPSGSPRRSVFY